MREKEDGFRECSVLNGKPKKIVCNPGSEGREVAREGL